MIPYYRILGVDRAADAKVIKDAYRQLARKFHPDHNAGHLLAQERFRLVAEAYDVLTDPERRNAYDRYGGVGLVRGGNRGGVVANVERFMNNLESVVQARLDRAPRRGDDKRRVMDVSLADACYGTKKTIELKRDEKCAGCAGTGAAPGTSLERCHVCSGEGQLTRGKLLRAIDPCPFCQARGVIALSPCHDCDGLGSSELLRQVSVEIPLGVQTGRRLVLRGYGGSGHNGGPDGDLFLEITVESTTVLVRDGHDLRCDVPITLTEAVCGATIPVPTLRDGPVRIRVAPGSQSGQVLRLKGRGAPKGNGKNGDLLVTVRVETPVLTTAEGMTALAALHAASHHPARQAYEQSLEQDA